LLVLRKSWQLARNLLGSAQFDPVRFNKATQEIFMLADHLEKALLFRQKSQQASHPTAA
jgi:hypothetical protein